ncbi:DUF1255 family protein [Pedobacter sp. HMF7647]|uniref:Pyrimidine/purine nucleoside phosphorylase n=1 Tax=Hufsiella arboris TaxID=2695275 RepID=A0A7K1YA76_9SPHI|nr:pyrimidine/purine nucleoside phosphorylase [Hufsiella arboris]MXV50968.1 DUF1255 family protein [Hufsiella arboris]
MIKINEYFDGAVKSLGFDSNEGKSSVGVIAPGEFEFNTTAAETMIVVQGELHAQLDKETVWESFKDGEKFEVAENSRFKVRAEKPVAYLCKYH